MCRGWGLAALGQAWVPSMWAILSLCPCSHVSLAPEVIWVYSLWVPGHQGLVPSGWRSLMRLSVLYASKGLGSTPFPHDPPTAAPMGGLSCGWVTVTGWQEGGSYVFCAVVPWLFCLLLLPQVGRKLGEGLRDTPFWPQGSTDPPRNEGRLPRDTARLPCGSRIPFGCISARSLSQSPCFLEINCCQMQPIS